MKNSKKIKRLTISTWIFLLVNDCSLGRERERERYNILKDQSRVR